ncbi:hypothetical protein PC120_g21343 [Phytophthora cactorum]|nr:hypothetical protein PC120_g21343 [Phytophthora cactorum]
MSGPTYAYAVWNALFTISVHGLGNGHAKYGHYGRTVRSWWIALQVTYGKYLPSLRILTLRTTKYNVCGFGEATVVMWNRYYGIGEGCFWIVSIGVSLRIFMSLAAYGAQAYVLCKPTGVFLLAEALNALNSVFDWTLCGLSSTVVLASIGVFSHGWPCALEQAHYTRSRPVP